MQCHPPLKHRRKLQARVSPLSTSQLAPDLHKELGGWPARMSPWLTLQPSSQQSRASLQPWEGPLVTCTGCSLVLVLPIPSTVVTATWCKEQMGARQALAEKWLEPRLRSFHWPLKPSGRTRAQSLRDSWCFVSLSSLYIVFSFPQGSSSLPLGQGLSTPVVLWGHALVYPRPLGWSMEARGPFSCLLLR